MRHFGQVFVKAFILVIFTFLILPKTVWAENEFSASYDVSYNVAEDGLTQVSQKITLKNLTARYYVSNFTLTIGSTTLTDVVATDENGPMETKVESKDNKTTVTVNFNQQVAGLGKQQIFTLRFKSKDFAQATGKVWEVNLPKIPSSSNIDQYNLTLSVPVSFGDPSSLSPEPKSESVGPDQLSLNFTKEQLIRNGVSVTFGTSQVFDFNLKYSLGNSSLVPITTSITLPPDTSYQDVLIKTVEPKPVNVTLDEDGNFIAWYKLSGRSHLEVMATGSAKTYIKAKSKKEQLSDSQIQALTKSDKYWEKDNPAIKSALTEIFKGDQPKSSNEKARLIYQYVINTLSYNTSRVESSGIERLGAVTALNNTDQAVCMEFTDLFVALARAAGIPAREMDGFAYSLNSRLRPLSLSRDLLHAWPEYYDEVKGWVMVDPTWENTSGGVDYFNKFDLNHLVLAIKGYSSTSPYVTDNTKVTVSQNDFLVKPEVNVLVNVPESVWAGFPTKAEVVVTNIGGSLVPASVLSLNTKKISLLGDKYFDVAAIPPFGFASFDFNLKTASVLENYDDDLEIKIGNQTWDKKIMVRPFFLFRPFPYLLIGALALVSLIYLSTLLLHLYKTKKPLPKARTTPNKS